MLTPFKVHQIDTQKNPLSIELICSAITPWTKSLLLQTKVPVETLPLYHKGWMNMWNKIEYFIIICRYLKNHPGLYNIHPVSVLLLCCRFTRIIRNRSYDINTIELLMCNFCSIVQVAVGIFLCIILFDLNVANCGDEFYILETLTLNLWTLSGMILLLAVVHTIILFTMLTNDTMSTSLVGHSRHGMVPWSLLCERYCT